MPRDLAEQRGAKRKRSGRIRMPPQLHRLGEMFARAGVFREFHVRIAQQPLPKRAPPVHRIALVTSGHCQVRSLGLLDRPFEKAGRFSVC